MSRAAERITWKCTACGHVVSGNPSSPKVLERLAAHEGVNEEHEMRAVAWSGRPA